MLEWNVYVSHFNSGQIKPYNIFDHGFFLRDLQKAAEKVHVREDIPEEKEAFLETLKRDLMYWYWSKCEWEIIISHWVGRTDAKDIKVDVYDQVMLNWDIFCEYVWANRRELKRKKDVSTM